MSVIDIAKQAPTLGKRMLRLLLTPRTVGLSWPEKASISPTWKATLAWALSFSALAFGLYRLIGGVDVTEALLGAPGISAHSVATAASHAAPSVQGYGCGLRTAVGMNFSTGNLKAPQDVQFNMGACWMTMNNVVPSSLVGKIAATLLLTIYGISGALCIYPAARLVRSNVRVRALASLIVLFMATIWVAGTIFIIMMTTVLNNILHLSSLQFLISYLAGSILLFGLFIRAFWGAFRALLGVNRMKFLLISLISWILSFVVAPIAGPLVYGVVMLQPWLDTLL